MAAASINANVWITILSFNRVSACIEIKLYLLAAFRFQGKWHLSFTSSKDQEAVKPPHFRFLEGCFPALSKTCNLATHSPIIFFFQRTTLRTQHKATSDCVPSILETPDPRSIWAEVQHSCHTGNYKLMIIIHFYVQQTKNRHWWPICLELSHIWCRPSASTWTVPLEQVLCSDVISQQLICMLNPFTWSYGSAKTQCGPDLDKKELKELWALSLWEEISSWPGVKSRTVHF